MQEDVHVVLRIKNKYYDPAEQEQVLINDGRIRQNEAKVDVVYDSKIHVEDATPDSSEETKAP